MSRRLLRKTLPAAALACAAWAVLAWFTGGVRLHMAGLTLRARGAGRPLTLALLLLVVEGVWLRFTLGRPIDRWLAFCRKHAATAAGALALLLGAHAIYFGTFAIGGADSYGYVSQAYAWARGELPHAARLTLALPTPLSDALQIPLGWRGGPSPGTMVPTYAPGLPLLMVAALLLGPCGPYLIVPLCAVLLVWVVFRWAAGAAGPTAGVVAALIVATAPIVLYQSVWAMSDVPAGALWSAAVLHALGRTRRGAILSGIFTAVGLLVRPNLVLLAAVPLFEITIGSARGERFRRALWFVLPVAAAAASIAALHIAWYGAPWASGYGALDDLFSLQNVRGNLRLYSSWFLQSQSAWIAIAAVPLLPWFHRSIARAPVRAAVLTIVATLASYVGYTQFEIWWYLRFLMPAIAAVAVLAGAGAAAMARTVPRPFGLVAAGVIVALLTAHALTFAAGSHVFGEMRAGEHRYIDVGRFVGATLPPNAIVFAMQHSGSVRFYAGRPTFRYDLLDRDVAGRAPALLERAGYRPFMVIDDWEEPYVRTQFGFPAGTRLPWPVVAHMRELGGVSVLDLSSGPRFAPVSLEPSLTPRCAPPRELPRPAR